MINQDEIFDLFADPYETTNLLGDKEYAEPETFLKETLANWVAVSSPQLKYPTLVDRAAELLQVRLRQGYSCPS